MTRNITLLLLGLTMLSCNQQQESSFREPLNEETTDIYLMADHYQEFNILWEQGLKSPIIEYRLFDGYYLGMSREQCDSVFKSYHGQHKLMKKNEIGKNYGTAISDLDLTSQYNLVYRYTSVNTEYYIEFYPEFINNKLCSLLCSFISANSGEGNKLYKIIADEFSKTDRGKKFKRFDNDDNITFIKDNLLISFYNQQNKDESTIQYTNIPQINKLNQVRDSISKTAQSANCL